jgi:hypothetical protein
MDKQGENLDFMGFFCLLTHGQAKTYFLACSLTHGQAKIP